MRRKYALQNTLVGLFTFAALLLINLVSRPLMLNLFGKDVVGLITIFTDVLLFLNVAEMGLGNAVNTELYGPLADKDQTKIGALICFYKKFYRVAGFGFSGLAVIAAVVLYFVFAQSAVGGLQAAGYFLMLAATTGASYFFAYRFVLLTASQELIGLKMLNVILRTACMAVSLTTMWLTQSILVYFAVNLVSNVAYLLLMNGLLAKLCPGQWENPPLETETRGRIVKIIKGSLFHYAGGLALNGTDNIYSAIFAGGLAGAAFFSNYKLIVSTLLSLIDKVFTALTSSIGHLLAKEERETAYGKFRVLLFLNFGVMAVFAVAFYNCVEPFISLWVGPDYLLSPTVPVLMAIYLLLAGTRYTVLRFLIAAGIFYEGRFFPLIEAGINIVASLLLGWQFGIPGIVAGNIISTLAAAYIQKPLLLFKHVFHKSALPFFRDVLLYTGASVVSVVSSRFLILQIGLGNNFVGLMGAGALSVVCCMAVFALCFFKTAPFREATVFFKRRNKE